MVIGAMLSYVLDIPFLLIGMQVGVGQLGACYGLGMPLLFFLRRMRDKAD